MKSDEIMRLIDKERKAQGMSVRELARRVGVSPSNVEHWIRGGGITLQKADKALKALGISAEIGGKECI